MRLYATLAPQWWGSRTAAALRTVGADAQLCGLYLISAPTSDMYGLYYLPVVLMARDCGCTVKRLEAALAVMATENFAYYDEAREFVWVVEMARWQLQLPAEGCLHSGDRRVIAANRWYQALPKNKFLGPFFDRYHETLHLETRRDFAVNPGPTVVTPTEPLPVGLIPMGPSPQQTISTLFEQWWQHYPKKVGKKAAFAEWLKIKPAPDAAFVAQAIAVVEAQKAAPQWLKDAGAYIPDPERWLKKGRWMDEGTMLPTISEDEATTMLSLRQWAEGPGHD